MIYLYKPICGCMLFKGLFLNQRFLGKSNGTLWTLKLCIYQKLVSSKAKYQVTRVCEVSHYRYLGPAAPSINSY